jgi:hypothetical protein
LSYRFGYETNIAAIVAQRKFRILAPVWKITNLGAGFYDITAFPNVERISMYL